MYNSDRFSKSAPSPFSLIVASLSFILIATIFRLAPWMLEVDRDIYTLSMQASYSKVWLGFWYVITMLGDGRLVYPFVIVAALQFLRRHFSISSIIYLLVLVGLFLTNIGLKNLFGLSRPVGFASFYPELTTFTFPSGHAVNGVILWYFLPRFIYQSVPHINDLKKQFYYKVSFYFPMMMLIAMSRVFLGVHWFSDVISGMIWGWVICGFALYWQRILVGESDV